MSKGWFHTSDYVCCQPAGPATSHGACAPGAVVSVPPCRADLLNFRTSPQANTNPLVTGLPGAVAEPISNPWIGVGAFELRRARSGRPTRGSQRLASATYQGDLAMKEIGFGQDRLRISHLRVVDRHPTIAQDPSGGVTAVHQSDGDQGINHRVPRCDLSPGQLSGRVTKRRGVQRSRITLAKQRLAGGLYSGRGGYTVHQCG